MIISRPPWRILELLINTMPIADFIGRRSRAVITRFASPKIPERVGIELLPPEFHVYLCNKDNNTHDSSPDPVPDPRSPAALGVHPFTPEILAAEYPEMLTDIVLCGPHPHQTYMCVKTTKLRYLLPSITTSMAAT